MEWQISGKNMEVSEEVRRHVEQKLGKLVRHLPTLLLSQVEISQEKTRSPQDRYIVQVTLDNRGTLLRSEARASDIYTAIDSVAGVLDRQIERYKGKFYYRGRGGATPRKEEEGAPVAEDEEEAPGKLVRVKRFAIKPMSVEEAIEQMELLGHNFFLFRNSEEQKLNLLYRRKDGDYGLIAPEAP
ncbi:MAG: ribosome-associated translation inhibitor RaiA [Dehalococcoidia bacterium]|nr:ribosome-associated translation inhibitor RaiA [Dehalococcoidia bacterium]